MNRWTVRRISLSNLRISKVTEEWRIGSSCGLRTFATCFAIDCESQSVINHCDRRFEFLRNQIKSHANERKSKPASLVEIETRPWLSIVINVIFAVQNIFLLAALPVARRAPQFKPQFKPQFSFGATAACNAKTCLRFDCEKWFPIDFENSSRESTERTRRKNSPREPIANSHSRRI